MKGILGVDRWQVFSLRLRRESRAIWLRVPFEVFRQHVDESIGRFLQRVGERLRLSQSLLAHRQGKDL